MASVPGRAVLTDSSQIPAGHSWRRSWAAAVSTLGIGVVVGVVVVVMASSYSALVFAGPLNPHLEKGIGLNLFGAVVGLTIVGLLSSMPGAVAGPQDVTAAVLALAAASIATHLRPDAQGTFLTVVLVMGCTSLATGVFFVLLGLLRLGDLVRYVPYPVVGGFLAGTGWLLVEGGVGIVTATPLSWRTISDHGRDVALTKWALAAGVPAVLVWTSRRVRHPLVVPAGLGAVIVAFYVAVLASRSSLQEVRAGGWLLGPFPGGELWRPWAVEAVGAGDWGELWNQAPTVISAVVVGALALLFNASGIELAAKRDLDLNQELRAAGAANILIGAAGAMPGYQKVSATVLAHALGAGTRMVALVAAGVCALTLLFGSAALSLLPRLALGGLVTFLGLNLLAEWVYDAWSRLRPAEYAVVVAILVVVAAAGFLPGVAVGTALALILFVVESSRIDVVTGEYSGTSLTSNKDREASPLAQLAASADAIHIVRLQGFLFFGTANRLVQRVLERADDPHAVPLKFLLLDFKRVSGIDSSAVVTFAKLDRLGRSKQFRVVLTHLPPVVVRQLARGAVARDNQPLLVLPDLDRGLEWCEDRLLEESPPEESSAGVPFGIDLHDGLRWRSLSAYLEEIRVSGGEVLIREGDDSADLFLLRSGTLTSFVARPGGETVRLRTMGPGSIIGEVGLYCGDRRIASVVADGDCTVYRLSKPALEAMERQDPQAAATLHRMVAGLLARRIATTLRSQRPYMD